MLYLTKHKVASQIAKPAGPWLGWLLALALLASMLPRPAVADPLGLGLGTDKYAHFGLAFVGQTASQKLFKKMFNLREHTAGTYFICAMPILMVGLTKEMFDSRFDGGDVLANVLGQSFAISIDLW